MIRLSFRIAGEAVAQVLLPDEIPPQGLPVIEAVKQHAINAAVRRAVEIYGNGARVDAAAVQLDVYVERVAG